MKNNNKTVPNQYSFSNEPIELDCTSVAYAQSGTVDLNESNIKIRSRVVVNYKIDIEGAENTLLTNNHMCSGTIAELPSKKNENRYLIFFDNGFVKYANRNEIYYIFDHLTSPIERLSFDHIYFLRSYFENYPKREMVQLTRNDIVSVYLNEKWHDCKVLDVIGSIVKLDLDIKMIKTETNQKIKSHSVWFYRGSPRLLPIYEAIMNKILNYNDETIQLTTYEKYLIEKQDNKINDNNRDSSFKYHNFSSFQFPKSAPELKVKEPNSHTKSQETKASKEDKLYGEITTQETQKQIIDETVDYVVHECTNDCVLKYELHSVTVKSINPLSMPTIHGWRRQTFTQSKTKTHNSRKWINYLSPCGRTLRSTGEVDRYLYITNSKLTIGNINL